MFKERTFERTYVRGRGRAGETVADPEGFHGTPLGLGCTYVLCINKGLEWPNERTFVNNEKTH